MSEKIRGFEFVSRVCKGCPSVMSGIDFWNMKLPKRATKNSACYDFFYHGKDLSIAPGELSNAIPTGVKAYMLSDEVLMCFVRSGHGFKYSVRLANSTGIIDSDYYGNLKNEGEIYVKLHNQGNEALVLKNGDAFMQAMFQKYLLVDGDSHEEGATRNGGLGSTSS